MGSGNLHRVSLQQVKAEVKFPQKWLETLSKLKMVLNGLSRAEGAAKELGTQLAFAGRKDAAAKMKGDELCKMVETLASFIAGLRLKVVEADMIDDSNTDLEKFVLEMEVTIIYFCIFIIRITQFLSRTPEIPETHFKLYSHVSDMYNKPRQSRPRPSTTSRGSSLRRSASRPTCDLVLY